MIGKLEGRCAWKSWSSKPVADYVLSELDTKLSFYWWSSFLFVLLSLVRGLVSSVFLRRRVAPPVLRWKWLPKGFGAHLNLCCKLWFWFSKTEKTKVAVCFSMYFSFISYLVINSSSLHILLAGWVLFWAKQILHKLKWIAAQLEGVIYFEEHPENVAWLVQKFFPHLLHFPIFSLGTAELKCLFFLCLLSGEEKKEGSITKKLSYHV